MTQSATILTRTGALKVDLPSPDEPLMLGVCWGAVEAFPTPAYWRYQVLSRRLMGTPPAYKLGRTLAEEVGACLLGGHGIPATVGIAAYQHLRERGAFSTPAPNAELLLEWLSEPLTVGARKINYRFAAQKSRYLADALPRAHAAPKFESGKLLRDWLIGLPGIGPKTASWVARNWMDADDVAILDIHILRLCQAIGILSNRLTVERHYFQIEKLFLEFSHALDIRPSELDAVMWHEMASSPKIARFITQEIEKPKIERLHSPYPGTVSQHQPGLFAS